MSFKIDMNDSKIMKECRYILDNYHSKVDTDTLSMGLVAVFSQYGGTDYIYNFCLLLEEEYEHHDLLRKAFHQFTALTAFGEILNLMEYRIKKES